MSNSKTRTEKDSLGELKIPKAALFGIHTMRSVQNFIRSGERINPYLIKAYLQVKLAAARTNVKVGVLPAEKGKWIEDAIRELIHETELAISGESDQIYSKIIVDPYQGGAGTSLNMNINEVIANTALRMNDYSPGDYSRLHPLDDVNMSQSTNDTFPTAVKLASIYLLRELSEAFAKIQGAFQEKEKEFAGVLKTGRTQYQDAVPITLGQEFGAYAQAMSRDRWRLYKIEERLRMVNLGGTAIGTGVAAPRKYILQVVNVLREITGVGLAKAEDLIDNTQNLDVFVEVHGLIKAGATSLIKIANDLRFLSSGPATGIAEIELPPRQHGSSIMPGKINPVIPEHVIQVSQLILGHDTIISQMVSSGHLELNAFLPIISHLFLKSFSMLKDTIHIFIRHCIKDIQARKQRCQELLMNSFSIATFLVTRLGYEQTTELIKKAVGRNTPLIEVIEKEQIMSGEEFRQYISTELGIFDK
ncbi:MAG: aspartate ammonia-lyase [Calditrichia bacterium]